MSAFRIYITINLGCIIVLSPAWEGVRRLTLGGIRIGFLNVASKTFFEDQFPVLIEAFAQADREVPKEGIRKVEGTLASPTPQVLV